MTEYYFSELGDDSLNTGLSPSSPWKNPWNKTAYMLDGNAFLLNAGDIFRYTAYSKWTISVSAFTSSGRFRIGSYSTGAKPILTNLGLRSGWTYVSGSGADAIYKTSNLGANNATACTYVNSNTVDVADSTYLENLFREYKLVRVYHSSSPTVVGQVTNYNRGNGNITISVFNGGTIQSDVTYIYLVSDFRVYFDGVCQTPATSVSNINSTNQYYVDLTDIYVRGDPSSLTVGVEEMRTDAVNFIQINDNEYFTIEDIVISGGDVALNPTTVNQRGITLSNLDIKQFEDRGFKIDSGGFSSDGLRVSNTTFDGVIVKTGNGAPGVGENGTNDCLTIGDDGANITISFSSFANYSHVGMRNSSTTSNGRQLSNVVMEYCTFDTSNNTHGAGWQTNGTLDGLGSQTTSNWQVRWNVVSNATSGNACTCQNSLYYGNVIYNDNTIQDRSTIGGINISLYYSGAEVSGTTYSNNIIDGRFDSGIRLDNQNATTGYNVENNTIKNNIAFNNDYAGSAYNDQLWVRSAGVIQNNDFDANIFYHATVTNTVDYKGTLYTVSGIDAATGLNNTFGDTVANLSTNQTFTDEAGHDYHVPSSSVIGMSFSGYLDPDGEAYSTEVGAYVYGGSTPTWTARLSAAFTASNGTLITAYTPDTDTSGSGFTAINTAPDIQTNSLRFNNAGDGFIGYVGSANQEVEAKWNPSSVNSDVRIWARSDNSTFGTGGTYDSENGYLLDFDYATNTIRIIRVQNGSPATLASTTSYALDNTIQSTFKLKVNDSNITAFVNSTQVLSATNSDITAGNYAAVTAATLADTNGRLDDFLVRTDSYTAPGGGSSGTITLDATSAVYSGAVATSHTFSHTIGSSADYLVVMISGRRGSGADITGVTYNGIAMTKGAEIIETTDTRVIASVYYMLASSLPSAGTYNVVISSTSGIDTGAIAISLVGADQIAPEATATSEDSDTTDIATVTDNSWVFDAYSINVATSFTPGLQTEIMDVSGTTHTSAAGKREVAAAGTVTNTWTPASSTSRVHALVAIKPAAVSTKIPVILNHLKNQGIM